MSGVTIILTDEYSRAKKIANDLKIAPGDWCMSPYSRKLHSRPVRGLYIDRYFGVGMPADRVEQAISYTYSKLAHTCRQEAGLPYNSIVDLVADHSIFGVDLADRTQDMTGITVMGREWVVTGMDTVVGSRPLPVLTHADLSILEERVAAGPSRYITIPDSVNRASFQIPTDRQYLRYPATCRPQYALTGIDDGLSVGDIIYVEAYSAQLIMYQEVQINNYLCDVRTVHPNGALTFTVVGYV